MRAVGIPVTTDYYIYSPDLRTWHCWNVVRDTTGKYLPFWYTKDEVQRTLKSDERRKGKAYRDCFGMQNEGFKKFVSDETVLPFFRNNKVKDVTANYSGENEISIPIDATHIKHAYIGVFKKGIWEPVDIAKVQNGQATFRNIEPNIVFQTLYSENKTVKTYGYPFVYTQKEIVYFTPDTTQKETVALKRKYPLQSGIINYMNRSMIGCKIEGAPPPLLEIND